MNIEKDMKLIKVLAADARNERLDSNVRKEANDIVNTMVDEGNMKVIAQTVAFTVDELQKSSLGFLDMIADRKTVGFGDKAAFNMRTGHVQAYQQAKGSTTARSMVGSKQILVDTVEISARPAISIMDLRANRVNLADLVREANEELVHKELALVESAMIQGVQSYISPFYGTGTGVSKTVLDQQLAYFRRLGPVNIIGDISAVSQLAGLTGMAMNPTISQHSDGQIDEFNNNGFIGRYNGAAVIQMENAYVPGTTTPVLATDMLYIVPAGITPDMRNMKFVEEGTIQSFASQNIDDLVSEIRLDKWVGCKWVVGELPTAGGYKIA